MARKGFRDKVIFFCDKWVSGALFVTFVKKTGIFYKASLMILAILVPVVGAVVTDVAVVHAPGVEPLELPVSVVIMQLVAVLLLAPVNISGLRGKPVSGIAESDLCLGLYLPQYKATNTIPAPIMMNRGCRAVWCLRDFRVVPCIAVKGLLLA